MTRTGPRGGGTQPVAHQPWVRALLWSGAAAGPLYIVVGCLQVLFRDGFDPRRHALSLLANGEHGWIQTALFLVCGLLVIAGAAGARGALRPGRASVAGPVLLAGYGLGLIGAGIFAADPALGFPPGTPDDYQGMSQSGLLHFAFGGIGFFAVIAASLVFAWRFAVDKRPAWAIWSAATGVLFFIAFAAIASGPASVATMLGFYAAVALLWIWHCTLSVTLLGGLDPAIKSRPETAGPGRQRR